MGTRVKKGMTIAGTSCMLHLERELRGESRRVSKLRIDVCMEHVPAAD